MSERKSPRVIRADYEISLVQVPPPGPPEYELVDAWIPRTPRSIEYSRRNKVPAVIATISLVIAIISISFMISMKLLLIPSLSTSTYVSTTTFTTTLTTTITDIPKCQVLENYNAIIRVENITFTPYNKTHRLLKFNVTSPNIASLGIDENNFTVAYKKPGENSLTYVECSGKTNEGGKGLEISCLVPYSEEQYVVHIYFLNGKGGNCIIAMLYI